MTRGTSSRSREPTGLLSVKEVIRLLLKKDLPSHHVFCFSFFISLPLSRFHNQDKNFAPLRPDSQVSLPEPDN